MRPRGTAVSSVRLLFRTLDGSEEFDFPAIDELRGAIFSDGVLCKDKVRLESFSWEMPRLARVTFHRVSDAEVLVDAYGRARGGSALPSVRNVTVEASFAPASCVVVVRNLSREYIRRDFALFREVAGRDVGVRPAWRVVFARFPDEARAETFVHQYQSAPLRITDPGKNKVYLDFCQERVPEIDGRQWSRSSTVQRAGTSGAFGDPRNVDGCVITVGRTRSQERCDSGRRVRQRSTASPSLSLESPPVPLAVENEIARLARLVEETTTRLSASVGALEAEMKLLRSRLDASDAQAAQLRQEIRRVGKLSVLRDREGPPRTESRGADHEIRCPTREAGGSTGPGDDPAAQESRDRPADCGEVCGPDGLGCALEEVSCDGDGYVRFRLSPRGSIVLANHPVDGAAVTVTIFAKEDPFPRTSSRWRRVIESSDEPTTEIARMSATACVARMVREQSAVDSLTLEGVERTSRSIAAPLCDRILEVVRPDLAAGASVAIVTTKKETCAAATALSLFCVQRLVQPREDPVAMSHLPQIKRAMRDAGFAIGRRVVDTETMLWLNQVAGERD